MAGGGRDIVGSRPQEPADTVALLLLSSLLAIAVAEELVGYEPYNSIRYRFSFLFSVGRVLICILNTYKIEYL